MIDWSVAFVGFEPMAWMNNVEFSPDPGSVAYSGDAVCGGGFGSPSGGVCGGAGGPVGGLHGRAGGGFFQGNWYGWS